MFKLFWFEYFNLYELDFNNYVPKFMALESKKKIIENDIITQTLQLQGLW